MKYWYLAVLCLVIMGFFIAVEKDKKYIPAVILKGLASLVFVLVGVLSIGGEGTGAAGLILKGLFIGAIADVLLNLRFVFKSKEQFFFLCGTFVFLGGHICYLIAQIMMSTNAIIWIIVGIVAALIIGKLIFTKIKVEKKLEIAGYVYILFISMMNFVALGNLIAAPSAFAVMFVVGAVFFFISDVVLIVNNFGPNPKFSLRITNLSFYYLGQLLIAMSLGLLV
ncbi:MAG: lysoplasmalogenase family protein [Eubacteriales bacterium]|nr:lysoplasmalogenase family protein [Eubacteriales bacterium]